MMGCIRFSPSFLIFSRSGTAITVLSRTSGVKGFLVGSLCGIGVVVAPLGSSGGVLRFDLRVAIKILGSERLYSWTYSYKTRIRSFRSRLNHFFTCYRRMKQALNSVKRKSMDFP